MIKAILALILSFGVLASAVADCPIREVNNADVDLLVERGIGMAWAREQGVPLEELATAMASDLKCEIVPHRDLLATSMLLSISIYTGSYKHIQPGRSLRSKLEAVTAQLRTDP